MRLERKMSRACRQAARARYVAPDDSWRVGQAVLLAPGAAVPAGFSLVLTVHQN